MHHRAEQAPDFGAGARPHQGVDRLGRTAPVLLSVVQSSEMGRDFLKLEKDIDIDINLVLSSGSDSSLTSKSSPSVS